MSILLKLSIDIDGKPYLKLDASFFSKDVEEQMLHYFITEALEHGLRIERKSECGDYCHIKVRG